MVMVGVACMVGPAIAGDAPATAEILYGATRNGGGVTTSYLFTIDPETGAQQQVGNIGYSINGLAWDPVGETLIGSISQSWGDTNQLLRIDPVTGAGTKMFETPPPGGMLWINTITVRPDGSIYAWGIESDDAVSIDRDTGEMTLLQDSGVPTWGHSFASDRDGNLFLVTGSQWISGVGVPAPLAYSVDPETGAATQLGPVSDLVAFGTNYSAGIARHGSFDADNYLYTLGGIGPWDAGSRSLQVIDMTTLDTTSTIEIDGLDYLHVLAWGGWAALVNGPDADLSFDTIRRLAIGTAHTAQNRNTAVIDAMSRELPVSIAADAIGQASLSSMGTRGKQATALRVEGVFSDGPDQGGSDMASLTAAIELSPGLNAGAFLMQGNESATDSTIRFENNTLSVGLYLRSNPQGQGFTWKAMAAAAHGTAVLTRSGAPDDLNEGLVENGSGSADVDTRAVGVEIGHRFITQDGASITPYAGVAFARTTRDAYSETGGATSPISYDAFAHDQSVLTVGVTADYRVTDSTRLHLRGGIARNMQGASSPMAGTSDIDGLTDFSVDVADINANHAFLGLGLSVMVGASNTLTVDMGVRQSADQPDVVRTLRAGYEVRF